MKTKYWIALLATCVLASDVAAAAPARPKAEATGTTPLTFENVRKFFTDTLRARPKEVQKRCALFYEGEWKDANTYNYCVIIVENSDEDVQVSFYITDDREMNWVNEFVEGPFFNRGESEKLYSLVHRERHARSEKVGRYRVDLSHWEPRHAQIIVLSFVGVQPRRR